jgi:antitoxin HicB
MEYHFKVHKEGSGFWAECVELKGCVTQGSSEKELEENMREALSLYVDEPEDSKIILPLPKRRLKGRNIVPVHLDARVAFAFHLRRARLVKHLTQRQAAKQLGFKNISAYQKLEKSKTANPGLDTIERVKKVFPELKMDEICA